MLLVTALRLVNGYRIVAATSTHTPTYHWSLERNQRPIGPPVWSQWPCNAVCFELRGPLAPGLYQVRLRCTGEEACSTAVLMVV
jgi:hypothetical protein